MKTPLPSIKTVLIANRSEVAARIQAAAHARGIKTVCIYAADDTAQAHLSHADTVLALSGTGGAAYLNQEEIIALALAAGADAIHPGYGFLSEVASFAKKVDEAGLIFIGPSSETISQLGDKGRARALAERCEVPVIPGATFHYTDAKQGAHYAKTIGYPILLKATGGGGGRGMAQVAHEEEFAVIWHRIGQEGMRAFHSHDIVIEKYVVNPRHIEVQIAGDGKNAVHFFERDCSTQRRRQKIIEEAPASQLPEYVRKQLWDAALRIAHAVNYTNIGTVEFIVDQNNAFFFLEVNTRLQVEHGVTEMITGVDLVGLQFLLAEKKQLPFTQHEITARGHALQCRIYAEDPTADFTPSTGTIFTHHAQHSPFTRIEHSLELPYCVSGLYDPMLSKALTYARTRTEALSRMLSILKTYRLGGVTTNIAFLQHILQHSVFQNNSVHTQSIRELQKQFTDTDQDISTLAAELSAALQHHEQPEAVTPPHNDSQWKEQQWS